MKIDLNHPDFDSNHPTIEFLDQNGLNHFALYQSG